MTRRVLWEKQPPSSPSAAFSLSPEQRARALSQLAQQTTAQLTPLLGTAAATDAYLNKTEWFPALQNGQSFRYSDYGQLITE